MRTKEVQLFERGIACRSRQAHRDHNVVVGGSRTQQEADRSRRLREVAIWQGVAVGVEVRPIDPAAELQRDMRPGQLLVKKQGTAALVDRWREGFLANGVERTIQKRAADGARETTERPVREHQFGLLGVVVEMRAHFVADRARRAGSA